MPFARLPVCIKYPFVILFSSKIQNFIYHGIYNKNIFFLGISLKKIERIGIGFENLGIFTTKKMKETSFIEQNKEKWKKFQSLTSNQTSDPEEIADLTFRLAAIAMTTGM